MPLPIRFKTRYPKIGEELELVTDAVPMHESWIELSELDSFVDAEGVARDEGGPRLDLAKVKVGVGLRRIAVLGEPELLNRPPPYGFLHGYWDKLLIKHKEGDSFFSGHWCELGKRCTEHGAPYMPGDPLKPTWRSRCNEGVTLAGELVPGTTPPRWRFYWWNGPMRAMGEDGTWQDGKRPEDRRDHVDVGDGYFDVEKDDLLVGRWWRSGETQTQAEKTPMRRLHLRRSTPYQKDPHGLWVPVRIGAGTRPLELWIGEDRLIHEVNAFLSGSRTRHTLSACTLEIAHRFLQRDHVFDHEERLWRETGTRVVDAAPVYAEYPVALDPQVRRDLCTGFLFHQGWLRGAGLTHEEIPVWPDIKEDLRRVLALLAPGQAECWASPEFTSDYVRGREEGERDFQPVRDSLITRFAAAGKLPTDENPFEQGKLPWLEFEVYRELSCEDLFAQDYFVEVYEHALSDERFPGATWAFGEGTYSVQTDDFAASSVSYVHVPDDCRVTLHGIRDGKPVELVLLRGWHDLPRHAFNDLASSLKVEYTSTRFHRPPPTWWLAAFLRGRQLRRIAIAAVLATNAIPSARLLRDSAMLGISEQDVHATFQSARREDIQMNHMVMMYCALGFDKLDNPFKDEPEMLPSRELFDHIAGAIDQEELRRSRDLGRRFHESIFLLAQEEGYKAYSGWGAGDPAPAIPTHHIEEEARKCEVNPNGLRELYLNAWHAGRQRKIGDLTIHWLTRKLDRRALNDAVAEVIKTCVRDQGKWGPWTQYPESVGTERGANPFEGAAKVYTHEWPELAELKRAALEAGVPEPLFMLQRNRLLRWELPPAQELYDSDTWGNFLLNFAISIPLNVLETLVTVALAVVDHHPLLAGACALAGIRLNLSGGFAVWCYESFENSVFRRIRHDTSGVGLLGHALLQSAETVLLGYGAWTLRLALTKASTTTLASLSARTVFTRTAWQTLLHGGAQWARKEGVKLLLVSGSAGVAEEGFASYLAGRSFEWSYALRNTLRNSAIFLTFHRLCSAYSAAGMQRTFTTLALSHMAAGYARSALDVYEASRSGDKEQWEAAIQALLTELFMDVVFEGATGVTTALVRSTVAKVRHQVPDKKLVEQLSKVPRKFDDMVSKYAYQFVKKLEDGVDAVVDWSLKKWPVNGRVPALAGMGHVVFSVGHPGDSIKLDPRRSTPRGKHRSVHELDEGKPRLTEQDLQALREHPGLKALAKKKFPGDGEGVVFYMRDLPTLTGNNKVGWGEGTQARFLELVLKELFPNARFVPGNKDFKDDSGVPAEVRKAHPGKKVYDVRVRDGAQSVNGSPGTDVLQNPTTEHVDMVFLKSANDIIDIPSDHKKAAREALGLKEGDVVVSLYAVPRTAFQDMASYLKPVFEALEKKNPGKDLRVILSRTKVQDYDEGRAESLKEAFGEGADVFMCGVEIDATTEPPGGRPAVIFNNTRGKMTHMHAAADLALVIGPINPFESLTAGTPTIQVVPKSTAYHEAALDYFRAVGAKSNAFRQLSRKDRSLTEQLGTSAGELFGTTPLAFQHTKIPEHQNKSAFDRLLDNVEGFLRDAEPPSEQR